MNTSRRTAVLSFVLLAAASAVPARVAADVYMPKPPCNKYLDDCRLPEPPRGCERYGDCPPNPCINPYDGCPRPMPHPMEDANDKPAGSAASIGKEDRMKELLGTLGGDDMAAKGAALNGFFDASLSGKAGDTKDAVAASAGSGAKASILIPQTGWRLAHTDPSVPVPPTGPKPRPGSRGEVRFLTVGVVDDLGNALRDRNDKKLEEATKQQKDTEKGWKDYKNGDKISPPGSECGSCGPGIAMTGKG